MIIIGYANTISTKTKGAIFNRITEGKQGCLDLDTKAYCTYLVGVI